MKLRNLFLWNILASFLQINCIPVKQVVIWGHKLHSHTHSYVHEAFYKAFKHLGYTTHWLDNSDDISKIDFKNTLFITEHQVDARMPLRNDCFYVNLNSENSRFNSLREQGHFIDLRWHHPVEILEDQNLEKLEEGIHWNRKKRRLHIMWATDLLPHEINNIKQKVPQQLKKQKLSRTIYWVGTIGDGLFGNIHQLNPFKKACKEQNIAFEHRINVGDEEHQRLIQASYLAPTIVGGHQQKRGNVVCRIFKNISYGQLGVTNSQAIYELFKKKIVYNPNTYQLFFDAQKRLATITPENIYELMDYVRDHHTYINRIRTILDFFQQIHGTNCSYCN